MAVAIGTDKFFFSTLEMIPLGTTGTWTQTLGSNMVSLNHSAAAESAVTCHQITPRRFSSFPTGALALQKIAIIYTVATADLTAAPTAVLDQITTSATTRATSRAAVTQTLAFTGTNTVGTASGASNRYAAEVTITTPFALPATDYLMLEMTWPCDTTSALKIWGAELYFQG